MSEQPPSNPYGTTPPAWGQAPPPGGQTPPPVGGPHPPSPAGQASPQPQPGWAPAYGGYQRPAWELHGGVRPRTLRTLGGWAQGLLWANVATWLVVALMTFAMVGTLASYHDGAASLVDVRDMEALLGVTALLLAVPAYVTAVVLFLVWQHHAHRQLAAVRGAGLLRYGPGLGVGCWFLPFANLVMPVLQIRDLWVASTHPDAPQADRRSPMVWWWWALFVGVPATWIVITFIEGFVAGATGSIAVQPVWVSALGVLTYLSLAVAAALGARLVANLTRRIGRVTDAAGWS